MAFVLDASIVACWFLADEADVVADEALERLRRDEAFVPAIWWFEVRNLFLTNERRGRIDASRTAEAVARLATLPIRENAKPSGETLLALARRHRLTAYDAAYLELARRRDLPLATLDRALANAARADGVPLLGIAGT